MDDYGVFKGALKSELYDELTNRGHAVSIEDITKAKDNGLLEDGITVKMGGANVAPSITLKSCYTNYGEGKNLRDIANELANTVERAYENYPHIGFDPDKFDASYIRENAYISVVNTAMNSDFLSKVPHEEIPGTDLSAYVKVKVGDEGFIRITNDHCSGFGLTGSEVIDMARQNTLDQGFTVRSMEDTLSGLMPDMAADGLIPFPHEENPSIVVITNSTGADGGAAIISTEALDTACEKMNCEEAIILPSSRHELIAVNIEQMGFESTSDLKEMVQEVNTTQVSLEDKLSDQIYHYDSKSHELTMSNEEGLFPEREVSENLDQCLSVASGISR